MMLVCRSRCSAGIFSRFADSLGFESIMFWAARSQPTFCPTATTNNIPNTLISSHAIHQLELRGKSLKVLLGVKNMLVIRETAETGSVGGAGTTALAMLIPIAPA